MALNRVQAIGNVGKDPEVKTLQNGARVANFSIAVTEKWKDKQSGEQKEATEWMNIVVWSDGLIRVIEQYVHKGSKLYVEGQFKTRLYEKDGVKHYNTEVVIQGFGGSIQLLGDPKGERQEPESSYSGGGYSEKDTRRPADSQGFTADLDDEIPF